jgi:hypothetical protein
MTLGILAALAATGCSSLAEDVCDEQCRCSPCSDRDFEDCVIRTEAQLDVYDTYDCSEQADQLYLCAIERGYCRNDSWTYDEECVPEDEDLQWCVSSASLLRGQPRPGPN